jgi:hypothetical protein
VLFAALSGSLDNHPDAFNYHRPSPPSAFPDGGFLISHPGRRFLMQMDKVQVPSYWSRISVITCSLL